MLRYGFLIIIISLINIFSVSADNHPSKLHINDTVDGNKIDIAEKGKLVIVHYTGWLYDTSIMDSSDPCLSKGEKFDSSLDRGEPFAFVLGAGKVIKGWDVGVVGMSIGGKRCLVIPPNLAYGRRGAGNVIPGNASLIFEIELLDMQ